MTALTIEMPGLPVAWARAGRNKGFTFTPRKQRGAMGDLKVIAARAMEGRELFTTALGVDVTFEYPWPKSMSPKKRALPESKWRASRPDADNLIKLVGDGLNGIVWSDDAIIAAGSFSKIYSDRARTLIQVRVLA